MRANKLLTIMLVLAFGLLPVVAACGPTPTPTAVPPPPKPTAVPPTSTAIPKPVTIKYWHGWGGHEAEINDALAKEFMASHPNITVEVLSGVSSEKILAAVAAGEPPDAFGLLNNYLVPAWAEQGALVPLDDYIKTTAPNWITDWTPGAKATVTYKGNIWGVPFGQDVYALLWNKKIFREVGLDPNKPPTTIAELDEYAAKLTKYDGAGNLVRLGFFPDIPSVRQIWVTTYAFGGKPFDPTTMKITANDPKIVKGLEWELSYAKKYDMNKVAAFAKGFGTEANDPFYTGQIAMMVNGEWQPAFIRTYAPGLEYGIAPFPTVPGEKPNATRVGGNALVIPKGTKYQKEAWEFIRWMGSEQSVQKFCDVTNNLPHFISVAKSPKYYGNPEFKVFLDLVMGDNAYSLPMIPVSKFYRDQMKAADDAVLYGQKTPKQAMDEVTANVQAELDKTLKK